MTKLSDEIDTLLRRIIREEIAVALGNACQAPVVPTIEEIQIDQSAASLLKAEEVAEILAVSVQRVYELARQSQVNGFPIIARFATVQIRSKCDLRLDATPAEQNSAVIIGLICDL